MRAVRVHEPGGSDALRVEDVDIPAPGEGELVIRVAAAGVNFIDAYHRSGAYPRQTPFTLGVEAAGTVEAVGDGVAEFSVGDRVATADAVGSYADLALVAADRAVPVPEAVDLETAAAALLQGLTAHYLTGGTYRLGKDDRVLIHAAAGGVGLLLVQMAKLRGATVYGTVSSAEKETLAREAGADEVIRYTEADFGDEIAELTGGEGLDVVYDGVGSATFDRGLECLRPRGMMVLFGQSSGPVEPVDPQRLNAGGSLFLTRPKLGDYTAERAELLARADELFGWLESSQLTVKVSERHPLDRAAQAHDRLEGRQTVGKALLVP
ncbi:MAG TPA: quinone oxidoreductase [Egibacteraceae bacterium]|nr:quinone oxidoreductase [Egibacteraceae bacterium]